MRIFRTNSIRRPLAGLTTLACLATAALGQGLGAPLRVAIDPGHGGSDPGAMGNGLIEEEVNLDVALRLRELLVLDTLDTSGGSSFEVLMTRTDDTTVSLGTRTALANAWPADVFVSIHHNAFSSPSANGTETFSFANGSAAATLRNLVQEELVLAHGLTDRGPKTANFFVLRETTMPAVLSEAAFLTRPIDAAVVAGPNYVDDSARAHLYALQRWVGVPPHDPVVLPVVYCTPKVSALGCVPSIAATGTASLTSQTPIVISCDNVVSFQFGLMIWSREDAAVPFFGGTLCLGGTIARTPIQSSFGFTPGNCTGRFEYAMTSTYMQSVGLVPGQTVHAQFWFRDGFSTIPVGLSDAVRFTVVQ